MIAGLLVLALVGFSAPGDSAELRAMRQHLAKERVRVRFLRGEERSLLKGLSDLEQEIRKHNRETLRIQAEQDRLILRQGELDRAEREQGDAIKALEKKIAKRATAMSRLFKTNLPALFRAEADRSRRRRLKDWFGMVLRYDGGLLKALHEAAETKRRLRDELEAAKVALNEGREALKQEIEALEDRRADRRALLEAIREERQTATRIQRELAHAARGLDQQIGVLHGTNPAPEFKEGGFEAQRGRLPWPVPGRLEAVFGRTVDPKTDMVLTHSGIDIRANAMTPVRAVFEGRVVYASQMPGYGRLMVIKHPGGFFTLYAHLESFSVRAQSEVSAHQVIGFVGDSGSTKGPYLYFELRKGRQAVDPLPWLSR